jgi:hypothetical protein
MPYCDDCGCRTSNGICSGCMEELYILENQAEFIDFRPSDEFLDAAVQQRRRKLTTESAHRESKG